MLIRIYQKTVSPFLGPRCRYIPTCSEYMTEAVQKRGVLRGVTLGVSRVCRCHPWGGHGFDPVR